MTPQSLHARPRSAAGIEQPRPSRRQPCGGSNCAVRGGRAAVWSVLLLCGVSHIGCTSRFRNVELSHYDSDGGYRFEALQPGEGNTDDVFVFIGFSGGGTRAASLAYGVLQGLRDIPLPATSDASPPRCLLDEVDVISSVSGGSFTAMGYGLWGTELFDGHFERRFLTRNVQLDLLFHVLNPLNLLRMPLPVVDSIDVAAAYYDEQIFKEKTYADLLARGRRPFVVINATDVSRQQTFCFTQDSFDILGSDLGPLPVGWAVAASSAFPFLLTPSRLHYYPGEPMKAAITEALGDSSRLYVPLEERWARSLLKPPPVDAPDQIELDAANHKYLYLLDGGLSDNLGLHAFIQEFRGGYIRRMIEDGRIKTLVVVIVDAGTQRANSIEKAAIAPSRFASVLTSANTGIYNNTTMVSAVTHYALLDVQTQARRMHDEFDRALAEHCPGAVSVPRSPLTQVDTYVVDVNFRRIKDDTLRGRFMEMITSFFLPAEDVAALIEEGRRQIVEHPDLQRLAGQNSAPILP